MTHKEKINVQFVHHRRGFLITWPPALFIKSQRGNKGLSQSWSLNEIKELYFLWLFNCNAGNSSHNQDIFIAFTAFKLELFYNSICQQEQLSAPLLLLQICSCLPFSFLAFCLVQTNSRPHLCRYFKAVLFSLSLCRGVVQFLLHHWNACAETRHSSELHPTAAAVQKRQLQHRTAEG